ncbi:putative NRPS-like protein biosynthetic cluster [Oleoguttula sp. CCFEE 5521]
MSTTVVEVEVNGAMEHRDQLPATIDELIQQRSWESGCDAPIVAYPSSGTEYVDYTPRQLDAFAARAAAHYSSIISPRKSSTDPVQVIGLLGPSNLDYLATLLGITRLGHTVLFLSTRISEEAYVGLLQATKATVLLVDPSFAEMGEKVKVQSQAKVQPLCKRADYDSSGVTLQSQTSLLPNRLDSAVESNNIAWIIHSSGSTGLPKPIYQTHSGALRNYANNFGLRGFITLPLFHAHGISCLFRAIHSKQTIYMYNAELPLTAGHLLSTLHEHVDIQILYAVPYALKLLAEREEGIECLAKLELVMFGGSACPKPIGDKLAARGVLLVSHYGTTETGQLMTSFRDRSDKDWDYVRPTAILLPYLRWEEQAPGIFELCVLDGWPSKVASNRPDNSYATKDLFEMHPTTPNAWRYYARLDDTLVLENGEKANPLELEGIAKDNLNVAEAVAFGANKPRLGLFLIPSESTLCSTDDELIDEVWPSIEESNKAAPGYSQMSRDMVKVLPKLTLYRRTDKGTVIRAAFYRNFKDLIDQAYHEGAPSGALVLKGNELISYLRTQLLDVASMPAGAVINADTDIFSLGVDSLQSIRLRSAILKNLDVGGHKLPQNFAFDHPTLQAMADELTHLRLGNSAVDKPDIEQRMTALIDKYSQSEQHTPIARWHPAGETMVVTGATGSLGAHIVARLASSGSVSKVYCLVRAPSAQSARKRVRSSLQERFVYHTLASQARKKIVALPSNLSDAKLGLDPRTYQNLADDITGLIHCAWSVNFNLALESFEKDCIAGTRHLLDLCLKAGRPSPARFSFCSSVSAVAATPGELAPEDLPPSLLHAQNMGYAQSKLVTEHIVSRTAQQTGMTARVLRVGQIVADSRFGVWNASEAIPMIFQTAQTIKALPTLDENPSWTPVDIIACSVIDLSASTDDNVVFNVTNPRTFHWTRDLLPLLRSAALSFDELSPKEWVGRLRASDPDPTANPPIKLVEFFAKTCDHDEVRRKLSYDTRKAERSAPALLQAGVPDAAFVQKFISYFETLCWRTAHRQPKHSLIVLSGPCGSGKSTVATALANTMSIPLIEGDDLHSPESRKRMEENVPLTDSDRWEWLARLRDVATETFEQTKAPVVAMTCSALRTIYRDELRKLNAAGEVKVHFLLLSGDREELRRRTEMRHGVEGHYMKPDMVDSQLMIYEEPKEQEQDVVPVDTGNGRDDMIAEVVNIVKELSSS